MFIDTHCHLTKRFFEDPGPVIAKAIEAGVDKMICVGTDLEDSKQAVEIANNYPQVFAAVGIHPTETCSDWESFEKLIQQPKVVAIGECGLENDSGRTSFIQQISLAKKFDKPLIIHIRNAWEELSQIDLTNNRGVFHCFSGNVTTIQENFYISFAGNVTFKNAKELQEQAKLVPLEKLLLETDSPFLSPHPHRGSQNTPANVKIIATKQAELHNSTAEQVAQITSGNACKLFNF